VCVGGWVGVGGARNTNVTRPF